MHNKAQYAPVILRLGLVCVFLWFGLNQLLHPTMWESYIPDWATHLSGMSTATIVLCNGIFELICAVLLAAGYHIRIVATLLAIHMFMIVIEVGLTAIGVRDIGLLSALISIVFHGGDIYSLDSIDA